jgi:hypothetical protein
MLVGQRYSGKLEDQNKYKSTYICTVNNMWFSGKVTHFFIYIFLYKIRYFMYLVKDKQINSRSPFKCARIFEKLENFTYFVKKFTCSTK